jgi:hypothetical protein
VRYINSLVYQETVAGDKGEGEYIVNKRANRPTLEVLLCLHFTWDELASGSSRLERAARVSSYLLQSWRMQKLPMAARRRPGKRSLRLNAAALPGWPCHGARGRSSEAWKEPSSDTESLWQSKCICTLAKVETGEYLFLPSADSKVVTL